MDVRSAAFGERLIDFKILFVPPCFISYFFSMVRLPAASDSPLHAQPCFCTPAIATP
jgi:hypothetical protein